MNKEKFLALMKEKGFWAAFISIVVIGIIFRLLLINLPLWYDEGCSWLIASKPFPSGINDYLFNKDFQHTPLYFYYLHFWIKLFGQTDIAMRLSSLIPSLFAIPLVYLVGKQISSKATALMAMFLFSTSVFQIYYASEVRMYPFVLIFTLLSVWALLRYIQDFKTSQLFETIIYNTILSYLMIGAPIFVISEMVCLISFLSQENKKEEIKQVLKANLIFLILLIPYFLILTKYFLVRHDFLVVHSVDLTLLNIIGVLQKFISQYISNSVYWVTTQPYIIGTKEFVMFLIPLFVMLFGIYRAIIQKDMKIKLLISITLITFLAFILTAQFKVVVLSPRYLIYISPLLLILASIGLSTCNKKKTALFLAFWLFAGVFFLFNNKEIINYKKNSLYFPAQYISQLNLAPSDLVIMPFGSSVVGHYLNSPRVLDFEGIQEFRKIENNNIYSIEQQQLLKMRGNSKMFSEVIMPDTNISPNFEEYISSNISEIPVGGHVLLIATGMDRESVMDEQTYKYYFEHLNEEQLMFNLMTEFFHSVNKILSEDFKIVSAQNSELQLFILYERIK